MIIQFVCKPAEFPKVFLLIIRLHPYLLWLISANLVCDCSNSSADKSLFAILWIKNGNGNVYASIKQGKLPQFLPNLDICRYSLRQASLQLPVQVRDLKCYDKLKSTKCFGGQELDFDWKSWPIRLRWEQWQCENNHRRQDHIDQFDWKLLQYGDQKRVQDYPKCWMTYLDKDWESLTSWTSINLILKGVELCKRELVCLGNNNNVHFLLSGVRHSRYH